MRLLLPLIMVNILDSMGLVSISFYLEELDNAYHYTTPSDSTIAIVLIRFFCNKHLTITFNS